MKYLLLIYGQDGTWEDKTEEERQAIYAEYGALAGDLTQRGKMVGGHELEPTSTATTVRVRNGDTCRCTPPAPTFFAGSAVRAKRPRPTGAPSSSPSRRRTAPSSIADCPSWPRPRKT